MKLQAASELYLGGTMIWLIDKDGTDNASSNDLSGIRTANGISQSDTAMLHYCENSGYDTKLLLLSFC
ncbi:hypothetical protein N7509_008336 [Penicillium cosmopolitanum]|uniref:Uncharacterized protein n=1 Tax=Penicillium cosmopolitanum TaxID=1131564 RepID=A0A9W9VME4_9EURO|nr:uncharacterized protein N7509_008336 [Penicillium cosmopolitanum]KAJ5385795.1 hypothetical protein N7509_008336 [Penicillium cosmopolitanum]